MSFDHVDHFVVFSSLLNHAIVYVVVLKDSLQNILSTRLFYNYEHLDFFVLYLKSLYIRCLNDNELFEFETMKESLVILIPEQKLEEV